MSGPLDHFPADIIRQLLIDLGVGSEVTATDWPAAEILMPRECEQGPSQWPWTPWSVALS
jgi:hypothetical protein